MAFLFLKTAAICAHRYVYGLGGWVRLLVGARQVAAALSMPQISELE